MDTETVLPQIRSADCNKSEGYVQQQQEYENSDVDKQQTVSTSPFGIGF